MLPKKIPRSDLSMKRHFNSKSEDLWPEEQTAMFSPKLTAQEIGMSPCPKIKIVPRGPRKKTKPRSKKRDLSEVPTWIPESREFSTSVINEMLQNLYSDTENLTLHDRMSLVRLESLWSTKFDADAHRPEPNPRPLTPPPPRKPRAPQKPKPKPRRELQWNFVDIYTLPDSQVVMHRLGIPRLRPHWKLSTFDVYLPAYIFKRSILDKYITWDILDRLMAMDNKSGTIFLQRFVNDVVEKNPLKISSRG